MICKNFRYKGNKTKPNNVSQLICSSNISTKTCQSDSIRTDEIDIAIRNQMDTIIKNKELFFIALKDSFYSRKQYKLDTKELSNTEGRLSAYKEKLEMLSTSNDSIYKLELIEDIKSHIESLEQSKAKLENKCVTEYDFEKYKLKFTNIFRNIESNKGNINEIDFRALFTKVIIQSKEHITFIIGDTKNIENFDFYKAKLYFETKHEYLVRKTRFILQYGIKYT